jgi:hypothetical protein
MCTDHARIFRTAERDAKKTNQLAMWNQAIHMATDGDPTNLAKWLLSHPGPGRQGAKRTAFEFTETICIQQKVEEVGVESKRKMMIFEHYMAHFTQTLEPPMRMTRQQASDQWSQAISDPAMKMYRKKALV